MKTKSERQGRNPWEREDGSIDAVQLQRSLREQLAADLEGLGDEEQDEMLWREAQEFMAEVGWTQEQKAEDRR